MEEVTCPNEENYFVLPDNFIKKNRKFEYDEESNILRISQKKVKKEKENIIVNKNAYKCLLLFNILLTIHFLCFIVYCVKTYDNSTKTSKFDRIHKNRKLQSQRKLLRGRVTDFHHIHLKEIVNARNNKNALTMNVMNLIKPVYIDSLLSKRLHAFPGPLNGIHKHNK
jgi:hypothetical protein